MKASRILQLSAMALILMLIPLCSQAQKLSGATATPAANTAKAGNLSCAFRIGYIGSARISTLSKPSAEQPSANGEASAQYQDIPMAVKAYPNPFVDEIRISFPIKDNAGQPTIQLIDNTGKVTEAAYRYSASGKRGTAIIDAASISSGKYIIRILTGGCIYAVNAIKI